LRIRNVDYGDAVSRVRLSALAQGARGRPAVLVEAIILLLGTLVFTYFHAAAGKSATAAGANARALQSVERALHLDIERTVNAWLAGHSALIQPAVYFYRLYYVAVLGVLLWVFLRHAEVYLRVRRTLVAMALLVLPVFWAVPMSPPRFALPGIVDIVAEHDLWGSHASRDLDNGQNHFSAMPSMHVGWSLWCAYAVWSALRAAHPRAALLSWVFPLIMIAVVLTTGNHYVLDVVGSGLLLVISIGAVSVWRRLGSYLSRISGHTQQACASLRR
jgi:PAP2 superfamily